MDLLALDTLQSRSGSASPASYSPSSPSGRRRGDSQFLGQLGDMAAKLTDNARRLVFCVCRDFAGLASNRPETKHAFIAAAKAAPHWADKMVELVKIDIQGDLQQEAHDAVPTVGGEAKDAATSTPPGSLLAAPRSPQEEVFLRCLRTVRDQVGVLIAAVRRQVAQKRPPTRTESAELYRALYRLEDQVRTARIAGEAWRATMSTKDMEGRIIREILNLGKGNAVLVGKLCDLAAVGSNDKELREAAREAGRSLKKLLQVARLLQLREANGELRQATVAVFEAARQAMEDGRSGSGSGGDGSSGGGGATSEARRREIVEALERSKRDMISAILQVMSSIERQLQEREQRQQMLSRYDLLRVACCQRVARRWVFRRRLRTLVVDLQEDPQTRKMRKRREALKEMLSTEQTYVKALQEVVQHYIRPLQQAEQSSTPICAAETRRAIFANLETIAELNTTFLRHLDKRLQATSPQVGDLFIKGTGMMREYTDFITNYELALQALDLEAERNPQFAELLASSRTKTKLSALDSYLILPVQRLPRYEMLLRETIRHTDPGHVDLGNLEAALAGVISVNEAIDMRKQEKDNREKLNSIQRSLVSTPTTPQILTKKDRLFIREGFVEIVDSSASKKSSISYLFMFNDLCLRVKPTKEARSSSKFRLGPAPSLEPGMFDFVEMISLASLSDIYDIGPATFQVKTYGRTLTVTCAGPQEKTHWINDLNGCVHIHDIRKYCGR